MEKDIGKISKNLDTDIVIRIDDFGGKVGLTIREFVKGERYTGFTKAGTRVPAEKFKEFKDFINSIDEKDLEAPTSVSSAEKQSQQTIAEESNKSKAKESKKGKQKEAEDIEDMAM